VPILSPDVTRGGNIRDGGLPRNPPLAPRPGGPARLAAVTRPTSSVVRPLDPAPNAAQERML